jgi:ADP-heptose:LPS heptosyltransferase
MKILIVRFSSIGDVVLTTPVVRCVKQQLNAEVHFITKKAFVPVLENNPYIDKIYTIEKSIDEVLADLRKEKYDVVVDLHNNVRTLSLKRKLGAKSYSFPKKNIAKFLLTKFKIDRMPKLHVVDRYFSAVHELGVKNDQKPCDFILTEGDSVELSEYSLEAKHFVAVAMGAQFATKQMPISLMKDVLEKVDLPIVLLGGPMDSERSSALKNELKSKYIIDFCFETPVVSVWGNTVPEFGMYPYAPLKKENYSIHEVNNLNCRPCSKIGYQECPKKHFRCMMDQSSEEIVSSLNKIVL